MASAAEDDEARLARLRAEIDQMRADIAKIPPAGSREALIDKAKRQKLLAVKDEVYQLLLERKRIASVVRAHEELHPAETEDCPICLEPQHIADDRVQHFACCGKSFCAACAKKSYEDPKAHITNCPMCRAPPTKGKRRQMELVTERAKEGQAWAQNNLARHYLEGDGIEKDTKEALKWFKLAAEQNFPDACCALGEIYYQGMLVDRHYAKSFHWFQKAADAGCAISQSNVGNSFVEGQGVAADRSKAVNYFTLAYNNNQCSIAGYYLGLFYMNGSGGLNKSLVLAKHYLEEAAKKERGSAYSPLATALLQLCIEEYGQPNIPGYSSMPQVVYWTRKAAAEVGDPNAYIAKCNLDAMENHEDAHCSNCYKEARNHPEKLKRCTRCLAEFYCGRSCQARHWKLGHKHDCIKHDG